MPARRRATSPLAARGGHSPMCPAVTAGLPVRQKGPPLKPIEAPLALAGVAEAVARAAPEMLSAVWQEELRRPAAGPWALEPPPAPAKGGRGPEQAYAAAHDEVPVPTGARLVDQFHEAAGRIGRVDDDLDGEVAVVNMKRSFSKWLRHAPS